MKQDEEKHLLIGDCDKHDSPKDEFVPPVKVDFGGMPAAEFRTHQRQKGRSTFILGLIAGVLINLLIILFLLGGNPYTAANDDMFDPIGELQNQPGRFQLEVAQIKAEEWVDHLNTDEETNNRGVSHVQQKSRNQTSALACSVTESDRFDCWPEFWSASQQSCEARGCCWRPSSDHVPYCFYPDNYVSYAVSSYTSTAKGMTATLDRKAASPYPNDVMELQVDVIYQTANTVRFRIFDPHNKRYEVPMTLNTSSGTVPSEQTDYKVTLQSSPFGIQIVRRSNGVILFDSRNMAPLVYADQFIQIGTRLSTPNIYGLGEHQGPLSLDINWNQLVIWARDQAPDGGGNLYGAHPFYLNLEPGGNAHGVFLFSSNALEVALQPYAGGEGGVTYRSLGGILDFFVFTGPSPLEVVEQYVSLIGRPVMPPFWSLGFHLCKYGYTGTKQLNDVIQRNRAAKIPYDVQWSDIDYMRARLDWTYDANGSYAGLNELVDDLHQHNQHYVIIVDPGISSTQKPGTYPPFDEGIKMDIFIKNATGQVLIGKVWPGLTAFPDFFHPNADQYWYNQMKSFHDQISYDGIWVDMNEMSNFVDGSTVGCTSGPLDNPPYVPPKINGKTLHAKTICPSAKQALSTNYNLHNMYGWSEMRTTRAGLTKLLGKRSFILSRSTFVGSGRYGAHWTGDNRSGWMDLYYSIPDILNANMFGIPLTGADTCGFGGNTTRELCIRWMQLAAFYPFMRNHNSLHMKPQDPATFDAVAVDYMRTALETRYSLLPFMYTWFYLSHATGTPVIRPLFMLFPDTEKIDRQFMWGDSLLVSPVLEANVTKVDAYFPAGLWYDLYDGSLLPTVGEETVVLNAPLSIIRAHVRGGSILPTLPPALTTNEMRTKPFKLMVAPDAKSSASGLLYWDDGESLDPVETNKYSLVNFTLMGTTLKSGVVAGNFPNMTLDNVNVLGVDSQPKSVVLNGKTTVKYIYNATTKVLSLFELNINLLNPFTLTWTP
ncbi:lysosomal alpha-glucosidase-like isoform X2 [Babylonia areolata]|uniref:lysosomal alpha-glucosidase-like isoform X2 n=1 Tax=Babylonia areolata TaxID=304850 RepID=UPI003FD2A675